MKRDAIQLVKSIYRVNKAKDKVVYLETFLDDFELLKLGINAIAFTNTLYATLKRHNRILKEKKAKRKMKF